MKGRFPERGPGHAATYGAVYIQVDRRTALPRISNLTPPRLNPPIDPLSFRQPAPQLEQACNPGNALCSEFFAMALRPDGAPFP